MISIILILLFLFIILLIRYINLSKTLKELNLSLKQISKGNRSDYLTPSGIKDFGETIKEIGLFIEDLLERMRVIEKDKKRIEAVLMNISDGILITDIHDTVRFSNYAACKLLSTDESIEGKKLIEITRNINLIDLIKKSIEQKKMMLDELIISKNNKEIHLIATAIPLFLEDSVVDIVITLHDVTRLKKLEEMRKDFVANVSHEIKTPLTAIKGFTETLLDGALNDKDNALRFLNMIKNHSDRLNRLVDDLLALSRIELGDIKMNTSKVDINNIIETVFLTLSEKATQKGLTLKKIIPLEIEAIEADRDKLIQILLNLVENSIKFTEKGEILVGLDKSDGKKIIYVQDTGIGIPQNHIHRLGERFYRVDRARSRELGGTGLGLAIVKHLVNAHGWNMAIESEINKGTRVNIIIGNHS
jgi:two-component system phosphate regulon sensor histidine kinase PhoR